MKLFTFAPGSRHLGLLMAGIALVASSLACCFSGLQPVRGSGRLEERTYEVEGFHGVVLSNQGDLTIEYGAEERLVIEAEENLLSYLEAEVVDDMLWLRTRPNVWFRPTRPIRYHLTVTRLDAIELTGSGNAEGPVLKGGDVSVRVSGSGDVALEGIDAEDAVEVKATGSGNIRIVGDAIGRAGERVSVRGNRVRLSANGSGDVRVRGLRADRLDVKLTGSGNLTIEEGRVEDQSITITGSGFYQARDLESANATAQVSGSGNVTIRVEDDLEARATGSGDVHYVGDPAVRQETSGSGDVERLVE